MFLNPTGKHPSFRFPFHSIQRIYLPKWESTHVKLQWCPSNEGIHIWNFHWRINHNVYLITLDGRGMSFLRNFCRTLRQSDAISSSDNDSMYEASFPHTQPEMKEQKLNIYIIQWSLISINKNQPRDKQKYIEINCLGPRIGGHKSRPVLILSWNLCQLKYVSLNYKAYGIYTYIMIQTLCTLFNHNAGRVVTA